MFAVSRTDPRGTRRFLNLMLVLAIIDFVLLVPLFLGMIGVIDTESFVAPMGMTHGLLFVALVGLGALGVLQRRWNWKYPAAVVVAGLVGLVVVPDLLIRRELDASAPADA
jgi:MYXO-CTERM domain-containing protein